MRLSASARIAQAIDLQQPCAAQRIAADKKRTVNSDLAYASASLLHLKSKVRATAFILRSCIQAPRQSRWDDLLAVIGAWGQGGGASNPPNVDGADPVNVNDLLLVINFWGACK